MNGKHILKTLVLSTTCIWLFSAGAAAQGFREVTERLDLNSHGRVLIENHKGSITVTTWDRSQLDLVARIEPGGDSRREREWIDETEIDISGSDRSVRIKTDYRFQNRGFYWNGGGSSPYVHYEIRVPETVTMEIEDHKSEIKVRDLIGELQLQTHKGVVEVQNQSGPVVLETHKGEVFISFKDLPESSRLETYKGDIEVALPNDLRFDLDVDVGRKGHLSSDFDVERRSRWSRHWDDDEDQRFSAAINGGGPKLRLTSDKGHIRLKRR